MRKTVILCIAALLSFFIFSAFPASAMPGVKAIFTVGQSSYTVNGQAKQMDAKAFIENGRTYVPIRYLALALGVAEKDIIWKNPEVTLKLESTELKLSVGSNILYKNGQQVTMDVTVLNRNGRTYLPARWVAEAFGYEVKWQPPRVLIGHDMQEEGIQNAPFPVQLIKLEMEVGSKKAIGTKLDGSKVEIMLDEAPYLAIERKEDAKWFLEKAKGKEIFRKYPPVVDPGVNDDAMYLPFVSIAKAFGVPDSNIKWDGKTLRMHWGKDIWIESKSGDNYAVWFDNVKVKLEAPVRVKNGVAMIDCPDTHWTIIPSDPLINGVMRPLLEAMPQPSSSEIVTGKPFITCSVYNWSS